MSNAKEKKKPQIERFREKARELETDESEEHFEAVVRELAKTPSKKKGNAKKKPAK